MKKLNKKNDVNVPYLVAIINSYRIIEEKIVNIENDNLKQKGTGISTYNKTSSVFEVGAPEVGEVTSFQIRLDYLVTVYWKDDNSELFKYENKIETVFQVKNKGGFDNWDDVPPDALAPYFSFVHFQARQRAVEHLLAAGIRGVNLPIADNIRAMPSDSPEPLMETTPPARAPATGTRKPRIQAPKAV